MFRKKKTKLIKKSLTWYKSQNFNKLKENQNIERTLWTLNHCFTTFIKQIHVEREREREKLTQKREEEKKNQNSLSSHFQEKELKKYAHLNRCDKCFKTIMRQTYITKELTAQ